LVALVAHLIKTLFDNCTIDLAEYVKLIEARPSPLTPLIAVDDNTGENIITKMELRSMAKRVLDEMQNWKGMKHAKIKGAPLLRELFKLVESCDGGPSGPAAGAKRARTDTAAPPIPPLVPTPTPLVARLISTLSATPTSPALAPTSCLTRASHRKPYPLTRTTWPTLETSTRGMRSHHPRVLVDDDSFTPGDTVIVHVDETDRLRLARILFLCNDGERDRKFAHLRFFSVVDEEGAEWPVPVLQREVLLVDERMDCPVEGLVQVCCIVVGRDAAPDGDVGDFWSMCPSCAVKNQNATKTTPRRTRFTLDGTTYFPTDPTDFILHHPERISRWANLLAQLLEFVPDKLPNGDAIRSFRARAFKRRSEHSTELVRTDTVLLFDSAQIAGLCRVEQGAPLEPEDYIDRGQEPAACFWVAQDEATRAVKLTDVAPCAPRRQRDRARERRFQDGLRNMMPVQFMEVGGSGAALAAGVDAAGDALARATGEAPSTPDHGACNLLDPDAIGGIIGMISWYGEGGIFPALDVLTAPVSTIRYQMQMTFHAAGSLHNVAPVAKHVVIAAALPPDRIPAFSRPVVEFARVRRWGDGALLDDDLAGKIGRSIGQAVVAALCRGSGFDRLRGGVLEEKGKEAQLVAKARERLGAPHFPRTCSRHLLLYNISP
ncbi:hypothetical protein BDK51DRAFT_50827, partial [Blyttiomyces helicus]